MTQQQDHPPLKYNSGYWSWADIQPMVRIFFRVIRAATSFLAFFYVFIWLFPVALVFLLNRAMKYNGLAASVGQPMVDAAESALQTSVTTWLLIPFIAVILAEKLLFWIMRRRELARSSVHVESPWGK